MFGNFFYRIIFIAIIISSILVYSGCKSKMKQENKQSQIDSKSEEKIIREGIIDVAAIDVNKDGKIFQCQMDWNVINDKKGICPTCGMELEEVTVAKAKENLVMNDYNVK